MANLRGKRSEAREGDVVYLVRRANGDIKIGVSENFKRRFSDLQREHGTLEILGLMPGYTDTETWLHQQFASSRIINRRKTETAGWGRGYRFQKCEWFSPSDELLAFIDQLTFTHAAQHTPQGEAA